MRRKPKWWCGLLAGAVLAAVSSALPAQAVEAPGAAPPLILISLDGAHPDYLRRGLTPALQRFARGGVRADAMRPSYPSLTFPNHYTLVTGLRPDRHGIVENRMDDPVLGHFDYHDRAAVGDGRWWGGTPLWVGAERAGLRSATLFWPGSEAEIQGVRPHWWLPYDATLAPDARVDQVLAWLDLPAAERPRFVAVHFEQIDSAGHDFGPNSPEVGAALQQLDRAIARLLGGLDSRGIAANVVIVSDHGMIEASGRRIVVIDELVNPADIELIDNGPTILLAPRPGREAVVAARLLGRRSPHTECWRKDQLPARWHYGTHARVAPIVCQVDDGWYAATRAQAAVLRGRVRAGVHGYAPDSPGMRAIFLARGPAFRRGRRLREFDNVHVYALLARVLGIAPAPNDGDPHALDAALAEPR